MPGAVTSAAKASASEQTANLTNDCAGLGKSGLMSGPPQRVNALPEGWLEPWTWLWQLTQPRLKVKTS